jgi:tetratricopeptide (TPR) repeat protein
MLALGLVSAACAWAQQKPFTREQVQGLVRDGLGDESGAKLIEQRGIDFAPAEDFLQSLKAAGASEAFLKALRTAKPPESAAPKKPLSQVQVLVLLARQVPSHRVVMLVHERGLDSKPNEDYLADVRLAGGGDELIKALKSAKVTKPVTVDPAAEVRQADVRQHVARGAELKQKGEYALAEQEYRAALLLDSQNAELYVSLSYALIQQKKLDDGTSAARQAVRLNPNNEWAHSFLAIALGGKGDLDGEIAEYREVLRLNPNNDLTHSYLGDALGHKGDLDGEIAEEREALRLNPNNDMAHANLGVALGGKGDLDGEIAEYREALRLNPNNALAHSYLGSALKSTQKPRVFVELWSVGVFSGKEKDATAQMTAFAQSCPQTKVTIDGESADYTLRLSDSIDPRFHDGLSQIVNNQLHLIYGYTLFDHQGNMVGSEPVGASLTEAAQRACKAALSNWGAR